MNNKQIELLAPAGNQETFLSAIDAGADAIYLGLKEFSARAKAKNFSFSQLHQLTKYAKEKNVKIFVAFNTLIKQQEINNAFKYLEQVDNANIDALIVQDLSVVPIVKKYFPKIALHASTQLAIHNSYGVLQAQKFGFDRVVLARELSFEQIKKIKETTNVELEVFCHGALCFCVSGTCLFSSSIGGYSGNRGLCTQPCRRLWSVGDKQGYFLSPKDFQIADYIFKLKELGVASLKIEGRMKSPDYVSKTVKAYRLLIDSTQENFQENLIHAKEILKLDYARTKTTCNFINNSTDIFEATKSKNLGLYLGKIENKQEDNFTLNSEQIKCGDTLRIVNSKQDQSSLLKVLKYEDNKIFYENIYIENGFEVYKVADAKDETFVDIFDKNFVIPEIKNKDLYNVSIPYKSNLSNLYIRIDNLKWINLLKNINSEIVIKLSKDNFAGVHSLNDINKYCFELPKYIDEQDLKLFQNNIDKLINKGCNKFFINNISHLELLSNKKVSIYAGQYLYVLNNYTADFLAKNYVKGFCVSWEDDISNVSQLAKVFHNNMIVYLFGFCEVATSKMKFLKQVENKNIKSNKDEFKIISKNDENIIITKYPVSLFDLKNNFVKNKINSFAIDLSYIEPNKIYITSLLNAFNGKIYLASNNKFNFERKLK